MAMNSLHDVLIDLLKDTYHAEKQLIAALPKMAKTASSAELRQAFEDHLEETQGHVERLEEAFGMLEMKPSAKVCHGMKGLVEEGKEVISEKGDGSPAAIDAALIAAAQKVEHYEITAYGTLVTFAETLGMSDLAALFKETRDEEVATDEKLTQIAEGEVNEEAVRAGEDEEGEEDEEEQQSSPPRRKSGRSR